MAEQDKEHVLGRVTLPVNDLASVIHFLPHYFGQIIKCVPIVLAEIWNVTFKVHSEEKLLLQSPIVDRHIDELLH